MSIDLLAPPPLLTADLPGIGGRIKVSPEDFEVEEIAAYEPEGSGDHLFLWVEKRGMGAEYFARQVAQRLAIPVSAVGTAGMKDRHAVTRQWVSVPVETEALLPKLESDDLHVLRVSRHGNKLKAGHLHGNRFRILVREPTAGDDLANRASQIIDRLRQHGMPNFYGSQRFGRDGETLHLGMAMLRGEPPPVFASGKRPNVRSPFLRKLVLSAAQSGLFNCYLARRLNEGLLRRVLPGDVMAKWPFGGMFVAADVAVEQVRFDARETVSAGPIFGRKTFAAADEAARREAEILAESGLAKIAFNGFGKLVMGTRRHNLIYLDDLTAAIEPDGVRLNFSLPAGSYATVLLRELIKGEVAETDENG